MEYKKCVLPKVSSCWPNRAPKMTFCVILSPVSDNPVLINNGVCVSHPTFTRGRCLSQLEEGVIQKVMAWSTLTINSSIKAHPLTLILHFRNSKSFAPVWSIPLSFSVRSSWLHIILKSWYLCVVDKNTEYFKTVYQQQKYCTAERNNLFFPYFIMYTIYWYRPMGQIIVQVYEMFISVMYTTYQFCKVLCFFS